MFGKNEVKNNITRNKANQDMETKILYSAYRHEQYVPLWNRKEKECL